MDAGRGGGAHTAFSVCRGETVGSAKDLQQIYETTDEVQHMEIDKG